MIGLSLDRQLAEDDAKHKHDGDGLKHTLSIWMNATLKYKYV